MRFRFLYLNDAGEEIEVGGLDGLRTCVAMGRIGENTLLYDAVTHEWAPARAHSAYREVTEQPDEPSEPPARRSEMPTLAPVREPEVPDAVSAFVEQTSREQDRDALEAHRPGPDPLGVVRGAEGLADRTQDPVRPPPRFPRAAAEPEPAAAIVLPRHAARSAPRRLRRRRAGGWTRNALIGVVAAAGLWVLWAGFGGRGGAWEGGLGGEAVDVGPSAPPALQGELAARIAEAEGSSFQDMVLAMDSLRDVYDLVGGPPGWLDGHYLATASAYPEVKAYWRRYRSFVADLRSHDTAFFRAGFVVRLRMQGIEGPVLSMRLARGMEDYRATQPARDSLYAGMDSLAATALELHDLLLEREADVEYDPVRPGTVSRDPVMEAFPRDDALRRQIWDLLDRIFQAMEVVQGGVPGSRDEITSAPLREILVASGRR